ncbi:GDP-mannose 4,6-dehydratase [Prochlorococcus sp. AH-736-P13]|nr:NAD-dependent epimerase/dehydratase family protein [Prochlorococcus sp. AH-736-P13]MDA9693775.1 GDP-mannose 4,6-dehydratase [Prochlorococcus sp. AH-736-P13]
MTILVTGAAGFIGFHICRKLLNDDFKVVGIDNLNDYYDQNLKKARLEILIDMSRVKSKSFNMYNINIESTPDLNNIFSLHKPTIVINLAAQAGVRYSLENPIAYLNSNIVGFGNILENCKIHNIKHLLFASSSSVYGGNNELPYTEDQSVNHPLSVYAASKRSNELMAHTYSHLYELKCTGLRFFTVYGPWGRPDMALFKFTDCILNRKKIEIFNHGKMKRDFTFIDDITESIFQLIEKPPVKTNNSDNFASDPSSSWAPFNIFNIGNSTSIKLLDFIETLEKELGIKAVKDFKNIQPGDVLSTYADCSKLESFINFKPGTPLRNGIREFIRWYKEYYKYD